MLIELSEQLGWVNNTRYKVKCYTLDCVFHFIEFGKLRYVHMLIYHTVDTSSELQWVYALNSEWEASEITHLLEIILS